MYAAIRRIGVFVVLAVMGLGLATGLGACGTAQGFGEDLETVGREIQDEAQED